QVYFTDFFWLFPTDFYLRILIFQSRYPGIGLGSWTVNTCFNVFYSKLTNCRFCFKGQIMPFRTALRTPKLECIYSQIFRRCLLSIIGYCLVYQVKSGQYSCYSLLTPTDFYICILVEGYKGIAILGYFSSKRYLLYGFSLL